MAIGAQGGQGCASNLVCVYLLTCVATFALSLSLIRWADRGTDEPIENSLWIRPVRETRGERKEMDLVARLACGLG